MTAWVVMTVARQEYGEMIFIKSEKGFSDKAKAEEYAKALAVNPRQKIDVPGAGSISCACEVGVYKIEID
jgi:hypothetical protein